MQTSLFQWVLCMCVFGSLYLWYTKASFFCYFLSLPYKIDTIPLVTSTIRCWVRLKIMPLHVCVRARACLWVYAYFEMKTTIWMRMSPYRQNNSINSARMNSSNNHYFFCSNLEWNSEDFVYYYVYSLITAYIFGCFVVRKSQYIVKYDVTYLI